MGIRNTVKLKGKTTSVAIGQFGNLLSIEGFNYGNDSKTTRQELISFLREFESDQLAIIIADFAQYIDRELWRF